MEFAKQLKEDQQCIEQALRDYAAAWPSYGALQEAMAYSLLAGGKRIRPVLTLEVCRMLGGQPEDALAFACGLEMIHTYSLIHDDLPCMDDDDFRRGKPTNHKVYGEATAVLAGDGLLTAAFSTLAQATLTPEQITRGVACLARAAGPAGMVGGQILDLDGEGKALTYEEIITIEKLKTGCMIEAAARLGAIAANASPEAEEDVADYARKIGLAFQMRDDLLDVMGDEQALGKPVGSDQANEKSTFVKLKGIEGCQREIQDLTDQAIASLSRFSCRAFLCDLARMLAGRNQ
ncbi:MAG: farnesyl diphosphate synthase [Evtepia sp.]|uniref:polyprenyl synthetase family protein n=1 Tax=Evtepia sp. TaxID=2773933 RepID=UPI002A760BA8|nr:farnesyl diphosphate synthase [Evtepia sp.]MDY3013827.1 farnesyl diphosphate synthase [Evtepia sp.]